MLLLAGAGPAASKPRRLRAVDGRELAAALRPAPGRARLVHLWASWCAPCVAEWPSLAGFLAARTGRALDVVLVALDEPKAAAAAAAVVDRSLAASGAGSKASAWLLLRASVGVAAPLIHALDPTWDGAIPTTWILDRDGQILVAQRGGTRLEELAAAIDRIAPPAPSAR